VFPSNVDRLIAEKTERKARMARLLRQNPSITKRAMVKELGVSEATLTRYLREYRQEVALAYAVGVKA
jgi:predicted DNA-binding transcriptional regulator YafY